MKWWLLKVTVVTMFFAPIMLVLAMQAAFTILNAIFPFLLGFTLAIGLVAGCLPLVLLLHEEK